MLSPLCFHGLTNCFSRKPFIFKNICVAPPGVPPKPLFPSSTTSTCRPRASILFIINQLRTLVLSSSSFSHSRPLFSTACRLFVQKQGGWGYPPHPNLCATQPPCPLWCIRLSCVILSLFRRAQECRRAMMPGNCFAN